MLAQWMASLGRSRRWILPAPVLALLLVVTLASTALAGEFVSGDVYRLPAGEVLQDDLYVGAGEVYIEGTLDGDLYAGAELVEIRGTVTGDVFAAANSVVIQGPVGDDVIVAGNAVYVDAPIGGDLIAAGGGEFPMPGMPGTIAPPGLHVSERAQVGGDGVLMGGLLEIAGQIDKDLHAFGGQVRLRGQVRGDARIGAQELSVDPGARVAGTLRYSVPEEVQIPAQVAERLQYEPPTERVERRSPLMDVLGWALRTVLMVLGFFLVGVTLRRFAPGVLERPLAALRERPLEAGVWGLVAAILVALIPILSGVLVLFTWIFWGLTPAIAVALVLLSGLVVLWVFSPLVTGMWLGERIRERMGETLPMWLGLLLGLVILVVLGRIPYVGGLVYLVSFVLALGGLLRGPRVAPQAQSG